MEYKYQTLTLELEQQIELLLTQFELLKNENIELKSHLQSVLETLDETQSSLEIYKANYERLQLAKAFGMSEDSKKKAHQRIDRLVRDIDNCLKLLND